MTDPIPAGYTTLTPYLCVRDGAAAIAFYTDAFGATLISRMDGPAGELQHAELEFAHGRLQLSEPMPDMGLTAPETTDRVVSSLVMYCHDVDATVERAVAGGATLREPVTTFVTGDRFGSIIDPFGHRWAILTRVEDIDPDEQQRRVAEWIDGQTDDAR
jgi:uncharacterized glyoxalase superfamily protein PhnB